MSPDDHRPAVPDLYETDFYLWTQAQAQAIRDEADRGGAVEWKRVAEEIEDMGKSDLRESYSRVTTIIEHLLKLAWSQRPEPRGGWEATIVLQRADLKYVLTASLRRKVAARLSALHETAIDAASRAFKVDEPAAPRDASLRWTLAQILGEENDPIA